MASIHLRIEGRPGEISVRSLITSLENQLGILRDLDAALSKGRDGSLEWVITEMGMGSLEVVVESRSRLADRNVGPEVAQLYVGGLNQIEHEATTPPYFTIGMMEKARRLARIIGRDGATGITLGTPQVPGPVHITPAASVNIDQLLPDRHQAVGSVEGTIEMVSIHGKPRFVVYHSRTRKAVECHFDPEKWLPTVKDALGRRANASGLVHYNTKGEPMRVDIDDIRLFRDTSALPRASELTGSDPNFTGGLESVAYLRGLRLG